LPRKKGEKFNFIQIFIIFTKNFNIMSLSKTFYAALIVAASSSTASYAQKCQFDVDKTDPISHVSFRSVKIGINPTGVFRSVLVEQRGSKYYMTFEIAQAAKVESRMAKGMEVVLHQQNGSVMLVAQEGVEPVFKTESGKTITTWAAKCEVSKDDLTALSLSPVAVYHSDFAYREMKEPAGSEAVKFQQTVKCLLK
jgi:hypothetical protein